MLHPLEKKKSKKKKKWMSAGHECVAIAAQRLPIAVHIPLSPDEGS
jgi:hypothetical protein